MPGDTLNGALAAGLAAGLDLADGRAPRRRGGLARGDAGRARAKGCRPPTELGARARGLSRGSLVPRRTPSSAATQTVIARAAGVISSDPVVVDPPGGQTPRPGLAAIAPRDRR